MSFKKNGETEIYITSESTDVKNASQKKTARYTVDDLVRDSEKESLEEKKEKENVSN